MKYTVAWLPSALLDLADIWNHAADRAAVTAAANLIDDCLMRDPLGQGEARAGPTRILLVEPLAVFYDVDLPHHQVTVWDVWRYPP
jgi:plasmid stabilization system protein ParE